MYAANTGTGYQCSQISSGGSGTPAWSTTWAWQNTAADNEAWNWIKTYAYGISPRSDFFLMDGGA